MISNVFNFPKSVMISLYEKNVLNQLSEWRRILYSPLPSAIYTINLQKRRLVFVGIGSSYWFKQYVCLVEETGKPHADSLVWICCSISLSWPRTYIQAFARSSALRVEYDASSSASVAPSLRACSAARRGCASAQCTLRRHTPPAWTRSPAKHRPGRARPTAEVAFFRLGSCGPGVFRHLGSHSLFHRHWGSGAVDPPAARSNTQQSHYNRSPDGRMLNV